uniref:AP2/ERF domain-containing protein n=1 Tax=Glycine max TaxID=3847 RepID=A0A0R0EYJ1_SOYBN
MEGGRGVVNGNPSNAESVQSIVGAMGKLQQRSVTPTIKGTRIWLDFDTAEQAARAYDTAAFHFRGHTQFPNEYGHVTPDQNSSTSLPLPLSSSSSSPYYPQQQQQGNDDDTFELECLDNKFLEELLQQAPDRSGNRSN